MLSVFPRRIIATGLKTARTGPMRPTVQPSRVQITNTSALREVLTKRTSASWGLSFATGRGTVRITLMRKRLAVRILYFILYSFGERWLVHIQRLMSLCSNGIMSSSGLWVQMRRVSLGRRMFLCGGADPRSGQQNLRRQKRVQGMGLLSPTLRQYTRMWVFI